MILGGFYGKKRGALHKKLPRDYKDFLAEYTPMFAETEKGNCLVVYFCYTDGTSNLINCIDIDVCSPFSPVYI